MNYIEIVCKGYQERHQQGTHLESYFKREAQKAKRDEFCEFNDFFNGCINAIKSLKANIQEQLSREIHENKSAIDILRQGRMRHEDGHMITEKEEIEEHVAVFMEQMNAYDLNSFQVYTRNVFENTIPQFHYVELIEIENKIRMAESEINDLVSNHNLKPVNEIKVNQLGKGKVIVNTGDNSNQVISDLMHKEPNKKLIGVLAILIPFLALLFYIIVEWDNVVKFFMG